LQRALTDPEFGMWLGSISVYEKRGQCDWFHDDRVFQEFCEAVKRINIEHPGIDERMFTLDRAFDAVHYLLSEARRQGEDQGEDMGTRAICGATTLPDHLRGTQGFSSGFSSPDEVAVIADWLSALTVESLYTFYDPEDMDKTV